MKFDPACIAMIMEQTKQYTDSQRLGRVEKKIISWDGSTEGRHDIGGIFFQVSDTPFDTKNESIKRVVDIRDGVQNEYDSFKIEAIPTPNGVTVTVVSYYLPDGGLDEAFYSVPDTFDMEGVVFHKGIYFYGPDENLYITRVETEVIHPIPAEYIPPLDALYLNGTDGVRYKLYVDAAGQLQVEVV